MVGDQHLGHASDTGGGLGSGAHALPRYEDDHFTADLPGGGHGVEGGGCQSGSGVFSNYKDGHLRSPWLRSSVSRPARPRT
ncbi:hypothetical protein D3C84_1176880 [compost metagenome]